MALDRFIHWKSPPGPSIELIRMVVQDYLGDAASELPSINGSSVLATLHGAPRFPFRSIPDYAVLASASEQHTKRWFEVYVDPTHIDVITRMTDEYTNVVAEGFAVLAARFWKGKRDPG